MITRSGVNARVASALGDEYSSFGVLFAASGKSAKRSVATMRSPAPMANSTSVRPGESETMRRAGAASFTSVPDVSVTVRGNAAVPAAAVAGKGVEAGDVEV